MLAVHDEGYVGRFERAALRGDSLLDSADNPLSPATWDAAWAAVEATLAAADEAAAGPTPRLRGGPPARAPRRAGLRHGLLLLQQRGGGGRAPPPRHGASRVAIFDFDVHHGNGTQHLFEARADVFYVSTHQYPFYPGTGAASETGTGAGEGVTLNVPLPAGTGDDGYAEAIRGRVIPPSGASRPTSFSFPPASTPGRTIPSGGCG